MHSPGCSFHQIGHFLVIFIELIFQPQHPAPLANALSAQTRAWKQKCKKHGNVSTHVSVGWFHKRMHSFGFYHSSKGYGRGKERPSGNNKDEKVAPRLIAPHIACSLPVCFPATARTCFLNEKRLSRTFTDDVAGHNLLKQVLLMT